MSESRFWLVWRPDGNAPTFRHLSEEGANAEAWRLARMNPGKRFFVLLAVSVVEPTATQRWLEHTQTENELQERARAEFNMGMLGV